MAYKKLAAFGAGELTPELHERPTLDKFNAGLKKLRNTHVTRFGGVISRAGLMFLKSPKYNDKKCKFFSVPNSKWILEWGHEYARLHDVEAGTYAEDTHSWTEDDLPNVHFTSGKYNYNPTLDLYPEVIYAFCKGKSTLSMFPEAPVFSIGTYIQGISGPPDTSGGVITNTANTGGGVSYDVEYVFTMEYNGVESRISSVYGGATVELPVTAGSRNTYTVALLTVIAQYVTKIRAYRRPKDGNAWGFAGMSTQGVVAGATTTFTFTDFGASADYTHTPPDYDMDLQQDFSFPDDWGSTYEIKPRTGILYQQRLIISGTKAEDASFATRPGQHECFTKENPLSSDSSLAFKNGMSGKAKILRYMDTGALTAFTTLGVYSNEPGALTPANITMIRKGNWVIDEYVAPLAVPGVILFPDRISKSIIAMSYSTELSAFNGDDIGTYSAHLFKKKRVTSWAFQPGEIPLIWVVFDDGTAAAMTYEGKQLLQAWGRIDTQGTLEDVISHTDANGDTKIYFVVERDGVRTIEYLAERLNQDFKDQICTDSTVFYKDSISNSFTVDPVTPGDWDGDLVLTASGSVFANTAGNGAAGTVFRYFNADGSAIDFTVETFNSDTELIVSCDDTYPSDDTTFTTLYRTKNVFTGLDHLNGKQVSIRLDGFTEASPLNALKEDELETYTVSGGSITLTDSRRGAIVSIGLPIVNDIQTLKAETVEQSPMTFKSITVNRIWLNFMESRGICAASKYPNDDTNTGMIDPEYNTSDDEDNIIGNKAQEPYTRKIAFAIPGDWETQGSIALRNVDPQPVEFNAIYLDVEVRGD